MRTFGFFIFTAWTLMSVLVGYYARSPETVVSDNPIIVENVCPPPKTIVLAGPMVEPEEYESDPIVIQLDSQERPVRIKSVFVQRPELLLGIQSSTLGVAAEAILKIPVYKNIGVYAGYSTRNDFSAGVSYQF